MLGTWLFIFELIMLAITGRQVVQYGANPTVCALWFPAVFFAGDLISGDVPATAAFLARSLSVVLLFLHFQGLKRFSGIVWFIALSIGAMTPFLVLYFAGIADNS